MRAAWKNPCMLMSGLLSAALMFHGAALAQPAAAGSADEQQVETFEPGSQYKPPEKSEWVDAGLDPAEYADAVEYQVGIREWKQLARARKNHSTAGWSCLGVGVLGGGILATIYMAKGWGVSEHPQMEVFAVSMVAIGATLLTGIVVATTSPGPEDFIDKWRAERGLSFDLGPTTLHPGLNGLALKF